MTANRQDGSTKPRLLWQVSDDRLTEIIRGPASEAGALATELRDLRSRTDHPETSGWRRRVLYFAAPLRPTEDDMAAMRDIEVFKGGPPHGERERKSYDIAVLRCSLRANLNLAQSGLLELRRAFPDTTFIAPWIASVLSGEDDRDPAQREAGLVDACAVVERCDGIVLWGSRLSDGMRREMEHGVRSRDLFEVYNMVGRRWQLALTDTRGMGFADWYSREAACHHAGL